MEYCNLTVLSIEEISAVKITCDSAILLPENIPFNGCLLGMMREYKWAPVKLVINDIEHNILLTQLEAKLGAGEIYTRLVFSEGYQIFYTDKQIEVGDASICLNLLNFTQSLN